jgi:hypothetical protein
MLSLFAIFAPALALFAVEGLASQHRGLFNHPAFGEA